MKIHRPGIKIIFAFLLFIVYPGGLNLISAQDTEQHKKWNFLTDVYLMFPYMDGETGIGENLILPVDATPGDIFSKLQMGAMLYLEAKTEKWSVSSDLVYMNLNQEVTPGTLFYSGDVTAKQFIWEPAGYRIISIDYDKTTDSEPFVFDIDEFGPEIRLGFNF